MHRDLKLENILLDKHGDVKLCDFGFTREYEGKSNYLQTWCGTVCYSAPEMLKGEKYAGEKVDVWSLGIILYALLVGELPFDDDDEMVTKMKILKEEPKYPDTFPPQAKELCQALLSKRPILRPTLAEVLQNPWLSEFAPRQQETLKLQQPAPFSTELEKEVLQRMRAAGVDIDLVIENVLAQRCDSLAGWWALLLEKEERKARRRERKRKEREAEAKSLRRLSAASSRLDKLAPTIRETDEEGQHYPVLGDPPKSRGRSINRRSTHGNYVRLPDVDFMLTCNPGAPPVPDLPDLPESSSSPNFPVEQPPPPVEKDYSRQSDSSSRPPPPAKDLDRHKRRSHSSMLQVVGSNPDLLHPNGFVPKRRRKQPFINHLLSLRNWIKETSKRARSPNSKASSEKSPKIPESTRSQGDSRSGRRTSTANRSSVYTHPPPSTHNVPLRPRVTTHGSGSIRRLSASPAPLTPRSSYRRSSGGLRGRKSTSSSVSSIRSMPHHHHTHSKASSTSSASIASPSVSTVSGHISHVKKSPHNSIKVLPATPTSTTFPSNIRLVRAGAPSLGLGTNTLTNTNTGISATESTAAFGTAHPPSPGIMFAKRKRSPFKGPNIGTSSSSSGSNSTNPWRSRSGGGDAGGASRGASVQGRRSGEIMGITEEDEEEEIEEVDDFSPGLKPGEFVVDVNDDAEVPPPTPPKA